MEAYYSSDEEIAWGPVTLREIKSNFKRPIRKKPSRRHTVLCNIQNSKMDDSLPENINQLNISGTSTKMSRLNISGTSTEMNKLNISGTSTEYYTPNDTLKVNGNSDFLEKISQVINIPCSDLSEYASILDDASKSSNNTDNMKDHNEPQNLLPTSVSHEDSCTNFIKALENRTQYDIENFQQTLIEDTLPEKQIAAIKDDVENENHSYEEKFVHEDEVIVLSDESESFVVDSDVEDIICDKNTIKKENDFNEHENATWCGAEEKSISCESISDDSGQDEEVSKNECNTAENEPNIIYEFDTGHKFCQSTNISEENNHDKIEDDFLITPQQTTKPSTVKESLNNSPIIVPEIDLTQFDDSVSKDGSLQLNDTLEEMNRLLRQGLDYTMSDEEVDKISPAKKAFTPQQMATTSNTFTVNKKQLFSSSKSHIPTPKKCLKSPLIEKREINTLTVTKASPKNKFKVPLTPLRPKLTHPTPPKSHLDLKNIVSPVGLYIKNSTRIPLKQKVSGKKLSKIVMTNNRTENKENHVELPEVVYEPSKKQVKSIEKHIVIPSYIKAKIREGEIVKHEGRIGRTGRVNQDLNRSKITKKLCQTDITNASIDQSLLDSTGDVSILTNKQAFIK